MKKLNMKLNAYLNDESGATMIEYALIAALISVVAISALSGVGKQVKGTFQDINKTLR